MLCAPVPYVYCSSFALKSRVYLASTFTCLVQSYLDIKPQPPSFIEINTYIHVYALNGCCGPRSSVPTVMLLWIQQSIRNEWYWNWCFLCFIFIFLSFDYKHDPLTVAWYSIRFDSNPFHSIGNIMRSFQPNLSFVDSVHCISVPTICSFRNFSFIVPTAECQLCCRSLPSKF